MSFEDKLLTELKTVVAERAGRQRRLSPRIAVRLVAVGAAAALIAAGMSVVQHLDGTDQRGRPTPAVPLLPAGPVANAQQALQRAALVAEHKQFTAPRPNQWIYTEERTTRSVEGRPVGSTEPLSTVHRQWRRVDGTQEAWFENGKLRIMKNPQPSATPQPGRLPKAVQAWEDYMKNPATMPTDPDSILRLAYQGMRGASPGPGRAHPDELVYTQFTHLLRGNVMPPKVEAAVFRAMAKIPGVTLYPKVTDVLGRPALNLGMTTTGQGEAMDMREDLLLDRKTYAYLGERSLALEDKLTGKIYPDRRVLVKKNTEFVFARTITKIVDEAGRTS